MIYYTYAFASLMGDREIAGSDANSIPCTTEPVNDFETLPIAIY